MKFIRYAGIAFGVLVAVLAVVAKAHTHGGSGIALIVEGLLPAALIGMFVAKPVLPRWAAGLALASFLFAGMKSSGSGDDYQGVMVAAFFGMLICIALLIKPRITAAT